MSFRTIHLLLCFALFATAFSSCESPEKRKEKKDKAKFAEEQKKKPKIPDMSGDENFMAFVSRLRLAVAKHDRAVVQPMMTADFGYRWDPPMPGETPFDYWDQHGLWAELEKLLEEKFVPNGPYMVAPAGFTTDPNFNGFRCGIRLENGGWRFAYFISGQDPMPN